MHDGMHIPQHGLTHCWLGDVAADDLRRARPLGHAALSANHSAHAIAARLNEVLEESSTHVTACAGQQHAS
jgi:hypothetical protein